jgi:hypothetical protein
MIRRLITLLLALPLAACDLPGMGPDPRIAQREADARAIGGACRHGLRSIEDCYSLNEKASKAAIFAGWKDMDQYMRDNKIEGVRATAGHKPEPQEEVIDSAKGKAGATHNTGSASKPRTAASKTEPGSAVGAKPAAKPE